MGETSSAQSLSLIYLSFDGETVSRVRSTCLPLCFLGETNFWNFTESFDVFLILLLSCVTKINEATEHKHRLNLLCHNTIVSLLI